MLPSILPFRATKDLICSRRPKAWWFNKYIVINSIDPLHNNLSTAPLTLLKMFKLFADFSYTILSKNWMTSIVKSLDFMKNGLHMRHVFATD